MPGWLYILARLMGNCAQCSIRKAMQRKAVTFVFVIAALVVTNYVQEWSRLPLPLFKIRRRIIPPEEEPGCPQPPPDWTAGPDVTRPSHCVGEPPWLRVENAVARLTEHARVAYTGIRCNFTDIWRVDSESNMYGTRIEAEEYEFKRSDFVRVECKAASRRGRAGGRASDLRWLSVLATVIRPPPWYVPPGPRYPPSAPRLAPGQHRMDVLLWVEHSLSRPGLARRLPRSRKFLLEQLGAVELRGYGVLGDGPAYALLALLAGHSVYDINKLFRLTGAEGAILDDLPFLWKEYEGNGYITALLEDRPEKETLDLGLGEFLNEPTDHYMGPFFTETTKEEYRDANHSNCVGSVPKYKIMMEYVSSFLRAYPDRPKLVLALHGAGGTADADLQLWLEGMRAAGLLNSTLLALLGDHGPRLRRPTGEAYPQLRHKLEERQPALLLAAPAWLRTQHPDLAAALQSNSDRLVTPFDLHATLQHALALALGQEPGQEPGPESEPELESESEGGATDSPPPELELAEPAAPDATSLFRKIPVSRSCEEADIEAHWCGCLIRTQLRTNDPTARKAATVALQQVNKLTQPWREQCAVLQLSAVRGAQRLAPAYEVMRFRRSQGPRGRVPDLSGATSGLAALVMRVRFSVIPGGAEIRVTAQAVFKHGHVRVGVSAINAEPTDGRQEASCVPTAGSLVRQLCHCHTEEDPDEEPEDADADADRYPDTEFDGIPPEAFWFDPEHEL